jgi:hypothetical protein
VILEVFDGHVGRVQVNILAVVHNQTRVFDIHAKVRDVIIITIFTIFDYKRALDWTSDGYLSRRRFCFNSAHE